jgi:hypothetical protein
MVRRVVDRPARIASCALLCAGCGLVADLGDPRSLAASGLGEGGRDASFASGDPGSSSGSSASDGGTDDASSGTRGGFAACRATCATPIGTLEYAESLSQVYEELTGRWFLCTGAEQLLDDLVAPTDVVGLEFGSPPSGDLPCEFAGGGFGCGGALDYLVDSPSGPVRGPDFQYQLMYEVMQVGPRSFRIVIYATPDAVTFLSFRYSPCPRELALYTKDTKGSTRSASLVGFGSSDKGLRDPAAGRPADAGMAAEGSGCVPSGEEQSPSSIDDARQAVGGSWRICSGLADVRALTGVSDVVGMEFGSATPGGGHCSSSSCAGGDLHYLVQGQSGAVRGEGSVHEAAYELSESGDAGVALTLSGAPLSGWSTPILYSRAPRQLTIVTSLDPDGGATMTALP